MRRRNAGFSLVEVLVAIVLLGAMVVPICTSLVVSLRINDKTDAMLQAQLEVSSAVEHLMAEGITGDFSDNLMEIQEVPSWMTDDSRTWKMSPADQYSDVYFVVTPDASGTFYDVIVTDQDGLVEVETSIRKEGA